MVFAGHSRTFALLAIMKQVQGSDQYMKLYIDMTEIYELNLFINDV